MRQFLGKLFCLDVSICALFRSFMASRRPHINENPIPFEFRHSTTKKQLNGVAQCAMSIRRDFLDLTFEICRHSK